MRDVREDAMLKGEKKMSYLKDAFQISSEIEQDKKEMVGTMEEWCSQVDVHIRPCLTVEQNEKLSTILEEITSMVAGYSFQIGYNSAVQTIAESASMLDPTSVSTDQS